MSRAFRVIPNCRLQLHRLLACRGPTHTLASRLGRTGVCPLQRLEVPAIPPQKRVAAISDLPLEMEIQDVPRKVLSKSYHPSLYILYISVFDLRPTIVCETAPLPRVGFVCPLLLL